MVLQIVSVLLALFYMAFFLNRFRRMRQIDEFTILLGMYTITYGILPVLVCAFKDVPGYEFIAQNLDFSREGEIALLYYELLSLFGFLALLIGYTGRYVVKIGWLSRDDIQAIQTQAQKNKREYRMHKDTRVIRLTAWLCLAIGSVSLYLWARAYGSIFDLIRVANRVRSGFGGVNNSLAFFKRPATLVMVSALILFTLILQEKGFTGRKVLDLLGLILSVAASWLYLFASDGRLAMVLFVLSFFWIFALRHPLEHAIRALLLTSVVLLLGLVMLYYMDTITHYLRTGVWSAEYTSVSLFQMILSELLFIPISGQLAIMGRAEGLVKFTIMDDLVTGVCAWLPSSLKIPGFKQVWDINTELWQMHVQTSGQMPCNMVSQGYYDLGAVGVILLGFILGRAARKFQRVLINTDISNPFWIAICAWVAIRFIYAVPYCSAYSFILSLFGPAVAILIYWCCKKVAAIKR